MVDSTNRILSSSHFGCPSRKRRKKLVKNSHFQNSKIFSNFFILISVSLFNIVKFKNDPCKSTSTITGAAGADATRTGTCLTESECNDKTGVKAGGCAQGFGVCCVFLADTCNAVVSENCTYARTPAMIDGNRCSFSVQKCQQDICALRLDFVAFATLGPANTEEVAGGACRDAFVVTSVSL